MGKASTCRTRQGPLATIVDRCGFDRGWGRRLHNGGSPHQEHEVDAWAGRQGGELLQETPLLARERHQAFEGIALVDDAMEDGALRGPGLINGGAHGRRASEARAVGGSVRRRTLPPAAVGLTAI